MNDHFEMKIQKLSEELSNLETCKLDKLKILNCRERELLAKKEMFLWQKSNAQMQVCNWYIDGIVWNMLQFIL